MDGTVWIRRCCGCGVDDLGLSGGRPAIIAEADPVWRCPHCGETTWEAVGILLAVDHS
jgi:hypothetical protein